jgi:hypothetical protein
MGSFFRSLGVGRNWPWTASLALVLLGSSPQLATAQEPVRDFSQLNTRLKPGDTIWVTDAQGREIKGRIRELTPSTLTLDGGGGRPYQAGDLRLIQQQARDSNKDGALWGLLIGAGGGALVGFGTVYAVEEYPSSDDYLAWVLLFTGIGAGAGSGLGALVDSTVHGARLDVFRASAASGAAGPRLFFSPVITPRTRGVRLVVAF